MSAKIKKIELNINGKKIELTVEEAKELRDILNSTFGYSYHYIEYKPYPYYPYPYTTWSTITVGDTLSCSTIG